MIKSLYGADVTKLYSASYANRRAGSNFTRSRNRKFYMPWGAVPYDNYNLLARTNNTYDIWNVVGSPVIFGSRQSVENVIDVLEGNATAETEYNRLLSQANPARSIYQQVIIKTNFTDIPADQYYMDLKNWMMAVIRRHHCTLIRNPNSLTNIHALQANSTERGVTYNVTTSGNITKLMITSDFEAYLMKHS